MPALLTCAVVAVLVAIVLFANEGRNILALAKAFDIDLRFGRTPEPVGGTVPSVGNAGWPWRPPPAGGTLPQPSLPPAMLCTAMAEDGQETPSLVTRDDGTWECSILREYAALDGGSSLFVQIRGVKDGSFSGFRIKFNLGAGGMTESLSDQASRLVTTAIRPLAVSADMTAALKQKLISQTDFQFLLGYYPVSFKQEISDATRFNLIVLNRPLPATELSRRTVTTAVKPSDDQTIRPAKGPRLSTTTMRMP